MLTQQIARDRGIACDSYKDKCLRRRIAVRMRARGVHTYPDYARLLHSDAHEYDQLLDALTINVTKFYRNPETWNALRPHLTDLWRERGGAVRCWSAGSASGEEPYTIAVLLCETARLQHQEALLVKASVDATDIDRESLARTEQASYAEAAFQEMPADLVRRWFTADTPRQPVPAVRKLVRVTKLDLLRQKPLRAPYDLIVCRNVVIYFDRASQEKLFLQFADALAPGGRLVLGKVETLFGPARERLQLADARERIYRRPPA